MFPNDMVLTLASISRPGLTNGIKAACWQYSKILILGWGIMYQNRKYVLETKPVLAGAERLKDLDFWVPPDVGSAHPASRVLYCVTDSHAARAAVIASLFDRCFLTVRTCPHAD